MQSQARTLSPSGSRKWNLQEVKILLEATARHAGEGVLSDVALEWNTEDDKKIYPQALWMDAKATDRLAELIVNSLEAGHRSFGTLAKKVRMELAMKTISYTKEISTMVELNTLVGMWQAIEDSFLELPKTGDQMEEGEVRELIEEVSSLKERVKVLETGVVALETEVTKKIDDIYQNLRFIMEKINVTIGVSEWNGDVVQKEFEVGVVAHSTYEKVLEMAREIANARLSVEASLATLTERINARTSEESFGARVMGEVMKVFQKGILDDVIRGRLRTTRDESFVSAVPSWPSQDSFFGSDRDRMTGLIINNHDDTKIEEVPFAQPSRAGRSVEVTRMGVIPLEAQRLEQEQTDRDGSQSRRVSRFRD